MHWEMLIQPTSVKCNLMIRYFSVSPYSAVRLWQSWISGGATHTSAVPPQLHFPSKSLCLSEHLPVVWVMISLSPGPRGLQEDCKAGTAGAFPFPIPLLSCSNGRMDRKHTQHPAPALFSLTCYITLLLLLAVLHWEHSEAWNWRYHSPPWGNTALPGRAQAKLRMESTNLSGPAALGREESPSTLPLCIVLTFVFDSWHYQAHFCKKKKNF